MAELSITATDVTPVEIYEQWTGPAAEALDAGEVVRIDTTAGTVTPANASSTAEARAMGVAITTATNANDSVTVVKRGILDLGNALGDYDYDAAIYVADTDGYMGTTAGTTATKIIGRIVPAWGHTTADKLLHVDCPANE